MSKSCSTALVAALVTFGLAAPGLAGEPDVAYLYWAAGSNSGGVWRALATMYFGSNQDVVRANLDGTGATILLDAGTAGPFDLEVDTVNDKLYISKPQEMSGLRRCELDGTACSVLVSEAGGKIDVVGNTVYHHRDGDLWRVDLDGGNPQQLSFGQEYPNVSA